MKNASFVKFWIGLSMLMGAMWWLWGGQPWPARSQDVPVHPMFETLKMAAAALIGLAVTKVRRSTRREAARTRSLEQAQVLVCLCGALMTIVIGNSLARALGLAGGASIIRFRTPVKDALDATILFVLLGLGMSCGLGAFEVAGTGTVFVCMLIPVLERMGEPAKEHRGVEARPAPAPVIQLAVKER